jgi:hypothetical protein
MFVLGMLNEGGMFLSLVRVKLMDVVFCLVAVVHFCFSGLVCAFRGAPFGLGVLDEGRLGDLLAAFSNLCSTENGEQVVVRLM